VTTKDLAALVADWAASGRNGNELKTLIRSWCEQSTAAGVSTGRQVALLAVCGIVLGGGQGGEDSSDLECPYCHARGNGGHGGFCPNWVPAGIGDPATWVGAAAALPAEELPLSDYAWRVLRYLVTCTEGRASASDVAAAFGSIGENSRTFIFQQLLSLEHYGLVQRSRETTAPYLWSATPKGHAANAGLSLSRRKNQ
jgi:hypothetical protein